MTSPFPIKTHETMDLARALLEEDSSTCTESSRKKVHEEEANANAKHVSTSNGGGSKVDEAVFRGLVVSKDSSTELIPTHQLESTATNGAKSGASVELNAGKGMWDDDGKPIVGKVFSRVIQIGPSDKPKQLKSKRGSTKKDDGCSEACCSSSRDKSSKDRPQTSVTEIGQQRTTGPATISNICPQCSRQFSDETMKHHMVFCTGSSKDLM